MRYELGSTSIFITIVIDNATSMQWSTGNDVSTLSKIIIGIYCKLTIFRISMYTFDKKHNIYIIIFNN